ncbi:MAG: tRNA pseudouridine(55) synthase TruB, partial [Planctomycetaceae bacterium]|nr:tRNA pseudouridine(55) synthase TruB [Planctomycetaceae bacterium]
MYGVINLDKPAGMTSRDCVNQIQGLVRPHKCGHAGTLDPMATGVLLVCVGPATRLTDLLHQSTKTYSAEFLLGISADTDDVSGDLSIGTDSGALPTETDVRAALSNFTGTIMQVPPAYSAVHVQGERAYRMARKGIAPQIQPREVY